jgi:hypothetical protein
MPLLSFDNIGTHRDVPHILETLKGTVPASNLADLECLFTRGMPVCFNMMAMEQNYQAYAAYRNHSTINEDPIQARQTSSRTKRATTCPLTSTSCLSSCTLT